MVMEGAHAVEPSTGATGTRSSSSINTNASGEIATLLAIVAPPPQRIAGDQPEDPMPCFFSSL
jgi:hypothetical protein